MLITLVDDHPEVISLQSIKHIHRKHGRQRKAIVAKKGINERKDLVEAGEININPPAALVFSLIHHKRSLRQGSC